MKKLALFEGSWQKVLIKVGLLLLVLFVVYRLIKGLFSTNRSVEVINNYIDNVLPNEPPPDNSSSIDPDTITDNEAELIANQLENYMPQYPGGVGTQTDNIMNTLQCLNGASLNKVYAEFGARDYSGTMMDLFGWFSEELSNSLFSSGVFWSDCVPACDGYWDSCYALTYQREIWSRSSVPITF